MFTTLFLFIHFPQALFDVIIGNKNANINIQSLQSQQRAIVAYYAAIDSLEQMTTDGTDMDNLMESLSTATELMEDSNAWEYQNRAIDLLHKLGIAPISNDDQGEYICIAYSSIRPLLSYFNTYGDETYTNITSFLLFPASVLI